MSKGFRTRYLMFNFVIIVFAAIITLRRTLLLQEFYSAFSKSLGWKLKHQKNIIDALKRLYLIVETTYQGKNIDFNQL